MARDPLRCLYKVPLASENQLQLMGRALARIPRLTAIAATREPPLLPGPLSGKVVFVTPQCHLGFFSVLAQVSSFLVSQVEKEAPNQLKNKRSTEFISKESSLKQMRFSKKGKNVETPIPTLNKPFK
jgi:hypothetical protein